MPLYFWEWRKSGAREIHNMSRVVGKAMTIDLRRQDDGFAAGIFDPAESVAFVRLSRAWDHDLLP
jgi:hypothetical protein